MRRNGYERSFATRQSNHFRWSTTFVENPITLNTLHYTCPSCHETNRFNSYATDRVELEREEGEAIRTTCKHCHEARTLHPNDIFAKPNVIVTGIATALVVGLLVALLMMGWILISAILIGAPFAVWAAQQKSASNFNGYMIRRTRQ